MVFSKERTDTLQRPDEDVEKNMVALEEALEVSDKKSLRTLMMNVIRGDYKHSLSAIALALNSEDSETAHYAASVLQEVLNDFRTGVHERYRLCLVEDEKQAEEITLFVYAGQDGAFTLYEDEGVNYNYEKGKYAAIPLVYNDAEGTLTIGDRTGEYSGMLEERIFNVVKVGKDKVQAFDLKAKGAVVKYNGKAQRVKL